MLDTMKHFVIVKYIKHP